MAELPLKLQKAVQEIADDRDRGASELALLQQLQDQQIRVIVSEARPRCEGYTLAEQLAAWAIPTTVKNIYFDVTPAHLITGWIDEQEGPMVQPLLQTEGTESQ